MTLNIIYVVMIVLASFFMGYLCGNIHKEIHHDTPKDSFVGAVNRINVGVYHHYMLEVIFKKCGRTYYDLSQVERECLIRYAERAVSTNIRKTDIRTQLVIKSMCK